MIVPIDTDAIRSMIGDRSDNLYDAEIQRYALCDEVDRLRAENVALAAALEDIAGMREVADGTWVAGAECSNMGTRCCWEYLGQPDGGPDEWCPVCVAEVAWSAWKLGGLG